MTRYILDCVVHFLEKGTEHLYFVGIVSCKIYVHEG